MRGSRKIRRVMLVALCGLLLVLGGCGSERPSLSPLHRDAIILAFGDSLTKGTGANRDQSYPAVLERLSGHVVANAGIAGELSVDGLHRLSRVLDDTRPRLMILCHGGNDMLRKKSHTIAAENIRSMIDLARARDIEVLLIGVPKPSLLLGTASFYAKIARAAKVPAEVDIVAEILSTPGLKSDPIHPNAKGYQRMAEAIFTILEDTGAL